jgi:acyl-CoA synthetase (AMP-forming)/AMP-acid ligase II
MLIGEILSRSAARFPEKPAVIDGGRQLSFAELDRAAERFAGALAASGIVKGARVAILAANILEYPIVVYGCARAGAIVCTLSSRATPSDLSYMLNKSGAELLFVAAPLMAGVDAASTDIRTVRELFVIGDQLTANGEAHATFKDFMARGRGWAPPVAIADTDPVGMTFTGGTTGFPKAVVVSHRNRFMSCVTAGVEFGLAETDIGIVAAPLFHAVGQFIWFQSLVMMGCTQVMLPRWDADAFAALAMQHKATASLMVPTQLGDVIADPDFTAERLATLRHLSYAGAPMSVALYDRLRAALPAVEFVEHYGQSETGPLTVRRPFHPHDKRSTVGRPAHNVEVRIVDRDGRELPVGEIGEVITRGDHVFVGYWDDPEQTATAFKNGDEWLWTGDLGVRDADGFITLVDRSKDMIVSGAENIYPTEIENALFRHPAVAECAVFGIPDGRWGEVPAAHVVLRLGHAASGDELIAYVAGIVARFKRPRLIQIVNHLPKTAVGKVQKTVLREPYWRQHGRRI